MGKVFLSLAVSAIFILSSCGSGQSQASGTTLPPEKFAEKMEQLPGASVIDVRTPEEFSKGHLQDAINIDWNGDNFNNEISGMDKSRPVFVYCLSGGRSAAAASRMRADGFTEVYEMEGGMMKWRAAGLPETTGSSTREAGMTKAQFDVLTYSAKPVLVDFYADWCAPCKKMEPYLNEIARTMAERVTVVRINADDNPQLCKALGIETLPVLQLYRENELTWTHQGYISREEVLKQLE